MATKKLEIMIQVVQTRVCKRPTTSNGPWFDKGVCRHARTISRDDQATTLGKSRNFVTSNLPGIVECYLIWQSDSY